MIGFIVRLLFGSDDPKFLSGKKPIVKRLPDRTDPAKDRTVIVMAGRLDAHRLAGAVAVLEGEAHAQTFPGRKARQEPEDHKPMGGFIPVRFRRDKAAQ